VARVRITNLPADVVLHRAQKIEQQVAKVMVVTGRITAATSATT